MKFACQGRFPEQEIQTIKANFQAAALKLLFQDWQPQENICQA